jgi:ABC-type antimicrobial peptide transport system permease subunit
VDHDLAMTFRTVTETLSVYYVRERLLALLSAFFGALALLLAALGLYGVTSFAVGRQRTEIGIRMALGADRSTVVRMVLGRVTLQAGLGIVVGAIASL